MIESGISAATSVMSFMADNTVFSALLGIAVGGAAISMIMGIFFRRG